MPASENGRDADPPQIEDSIVRSDSADLDGGMEIENQNDDPTTFNPDPYDQPTEGSIEDATIPEDISVVTAMDLFAYQQTSEASKQVHSKDVQVMVSQRFLEPETTDAVIVDMTTQNDDLTGGVTFALDMATTNERLAEELTDSDLFDYTHGAGEAMNDITTVGVVNIESVEMEANSSSEYMVADSTSDGTEIVTASSNTVKSMSVSTQHDVSIDETVASLLITDYTQTTEVSLYSSIESKDIDGGATVRALVDKAALVDQSMEVSQPDIADGQSSRHVTTDILTDNYSVVSSTTKQDIIVERSVAQDVFDGPQHVLDYPTGRVSTSATPTMTQRMPTTTPTQQQVL